MPSARRSGRLSGVRKTYSNDPLPDEGSGSEDLGETSRTPRDKGKRPIRGDDDESDDEFHMQEEDAEDDGLGDEDAEAENDVVDDNEEEEEADEPVISAAEEPETKGPRPGGRRKPSTVRVDRARQNKQRRPDGAIVLTGSESHSRGVWNPLEHVGKSVHLQVTFGLDEKDLLAILYTRDRWSKGVDTTFPTRASLDEAGSLQDYKYGSTFGLEPEQMEREKTSSWDWYYTKEPGQRFRERQRMEPVTESEVRQIFLPTPKRGKHTVLLGPVDHQTEFNLNQYDILNFGDAWEELKQGKSQKNGTQPKNKKRQGWILNIGQRIQSVAWAPNQSDPIQYLAAVAPISSEQKEKYPDPLKDYAAPAFRPSAPYPCALQFWAFKANDAGEITKTIDMSYEPSLRLVLGTQWGDLRRMAWCPVPRESRDEDNHEFQNLGLLAGVWGDGYVRVLDVKVNKKTSKTEFCEFAMMSLYHGTNNLKTELMLLYLKQSPHPQYVHA